ncbi:MAG: hypothetical protein NTZ74_04550 [Chloroflexi bacterium]|nr:hypothetical protein [Chloroflexota bacterium]
MRIRKLIIVLSIVLLSASAVAATLNQIPDSTLFEPFSGNPSKKSVIRAYTSADLPWTRSSFMVISSVEDSQSVEDTFRNRFGGYTMLNGAIDGGGFFYSATNRVLGGYVIWPTIIPFGQTTRVSDSLSLAVQNIRTFSAVDSNLLFDALDDSVTPTDIQQVTDYFRKPMFDYKNKVLIPKSCTLVIAEVVAESGCIPESSAFSVQLKGYLSVDPIRDDFSNPIGSLGKYRLLPSINIEPVEGVDNGACVQQAWMFVLIPAEGFSETNLYVKLNTSSLRGASDVVWTGVK